MFGNCRPPREKKEAWPRWMLWRVLPRGQVEATVPPGGHGPPRTPPGHFSQCAGGGRAKFPVRYISGTDPYRACARGAGFCLPVYRKVRSGKENLASFQGTGVFFTTHWTLTIETSMAGNHLWERAAAVP